MVMGGIRQYKARQVSLRTGETLSYMYVYKCRNMLAIYVHVCTCTVCIGLCVYMCVCTNTYILTCALKYVHAWKINV